jgi:hypothetical protein
MNLPSDTPRLPKWIFFISALALLGLAWAIHDNADHPWAPGPLVSAVICVAAACMLNVIPFASDYARKQDEALDNRQRSLQALAATVASSAEQIAIATGGLQKLTGVAQDNVTQAEGAARQIQERILELRALLAETRRGDDGAAAKLDAVAKRISKSVAELDEAASRLAEAAKAVPAAAPRRAPSSQPEPEEPAAFPKVVPEPPPVISHEIPEVRPVMAPTPHTSFDPPPAEPAAEAAPEPSPAVVPEKIPRKRGPRKPPAEPLPATDLVLEAVADDPAPPPSPPEVSEPAVSSDGATRIIVTAYIGIGNRLFIRGDGPGLSRDTGIPLSFVSIGKWRWETNEATAPVSFRLYKNDEIECSALGERSVAPGAQLDLTASF